ncbi:unnamed protein product, partial [marine sediment metagenome]
MNESDEMCPKCGSTKRTTGPIHHEKESKPALGINIISTKPEHEAHMSAESWAIFGLILGLIIPPTFYVVFSIFEILFWQKLLIWLG